MDLFEDCTTSFRVNLLDLDINFHMNNGRYLSIMDLGRCDLMLKSGIFWKLFKNGYYPVVVSESIRFRKSLDPFQKFELVSRIESWDEKDFFIVQRFMRGDTVMAEGYIKGRFKQRGRKGSVPTAEVFSIVGKPFDKSHITGLAKAQNAVESLLAPKAEQQEEIR